MKRRAFLKHLAGATALALPRVSIARQAQPRIGVVGGGIVGTSICLHLAKAGAEVTLFEREAPAAGATSKSFAWLNAMTDNVDYHQLRRRSLRAWAALDSEHELQINWGGVFMWEPDTAAAEEAAAELRALHAAISSPDYLVRSLTPSDFSSIAPHLSPGTFEIALHCGIDGHIDPVAVTNKLLKAARGHGVELIMPCEVTGLRMEGRRIGVATTVGDYHLDRLVIAAGVDSRRLTSLVGYRPPLDHAPGILVGRDPATARAVRREVRGSAELPAGRLFLLLHRVGRTAGGDSRPRCSTTGVVVVRPAGPDLLRQAGSRGRGNTGERHGAPAHPDPCRTLGSVSAVVTPASR